MRERPEHPVDGPLVVDPAQWLACLDRMRGELDRLRAGFGAGGGSGGAPGGGPGGGFGAGSVVGSVTGSGAGAVVGSIPGSIPGSVTGSVTGPVVGSTVGSIVGSTEHPAAVEDARRRGLLCDLLAGSLGQAAEYLARLSLDTDDPEHRQAHDPGPATSTPARSAARPPHVGPATPFTLGDAEEGLLPWRHLRRLFVEPDPGGLLPEQRRTPRLPAPASGTGPVASAEWHLDRDDVRWSEEMYTLFDRDPGLGPLSLTELPAHAAPEDREFVTDLVYELLEHANGVEGEFRIVRRDGTRMSVQFVGEPVLGPDDRPYAVWALLRNITELRRTQQALTETRGQLLAQRRLLRSEHRIAAELQRVVMPWWTRPIALPGIEVATRYFPAEQDSKVGGDWYDALALPGGDVLLAVGDMSGHGIAAASGMSTLRGALQGVAMTGAGPAAMLAALNRIVVHTLPADKVATAVCARFEPVARVLTWAQGGHPPPLLYRDGLGRALRAPYGMLLGAVDEPEFVEDRVELRPGDVLLIFTDGLVERRGRGTEEAVEALLTLGPRLAGADARTCVDVVLSRLGHTRYEDDACVMAVCVR
ncbi:PP2C family protein-serine/threonine phosphatase [Embleya sp. AB8]|uniref:PP2C family protein-serine/threonine phosphatase n=1 Tax=Embleya sp. AB8 TaxID=3156304 RepID=UPI003C745899